MTTTYGVSAAALVAAALAVGPALGQELNFSGSFGEGGFDRYVPPVTHFTLNETPFITTEVRPIFLYHAIPSGFATQGGRIIGGAVQARLALTERFAIIATTDGYADLNFDAVLPDTDGFLDLAAGVKYAIINNPAEGNIVTVGIRYTAPVGNIDSAGLDFTGSTKGQLDSFVTGAKLWDGGTQAQGSFGFVWGIGDESTSFFHAHGHLDHEVFEGFFPLVEANLLVPVDGGDRIPGSNLTGADVFDLGAENTQGIFTLGIGARYNPFETVSFGAAVEGNVFDLGDEEAVSAFGWRVTTDVTIRF